MGTDRTASSAAELRRSFSDEAGEVTAHIKSLFSSLEKDSGNFALKKEISDCFALLERTSRHLGDAETGFLCGSARSIFTSLIDARIMLTERVRQTVLLVCERIENPESAGEGGTVTLIKLCNSIASGEIVDMGEFSESLLPPKDIEFLASADPAPNADGAGESDITIRKSWLENIIFEAESLAAKATGAKLVIQSLPDSAAKHELEKCIAEISGQAGRARARLSALLMVPVQSLFDELSAEFDFCSFEPTEAKVEDEIMPRLKPVIQSLVQSALSFGGASRVTVSAEPVADRVRLCVGDNGRGIDFDDLARRSSELFPEEAEKIASLSQAELSAYLFREGVTSDDGSGLDGVFQQVEKLKGHIRADLACEQGTAFVLSIPQSLKTERGLFILSGGKKLFVSGHHIRTVISKPKGEIITIQNQKYINYEKKLLPIYTLSSIFANQPDKKTADLKTILIAEYMEEKIGIVVRSVLGYASPSIQPLPRAFKDFRLLRGVVRDENFSLIPVLYIPEVMTHLSALRMYDIKKFDAGSRKKKPRVLLVDDSDASRSVLDAVLRSNGYLTETASDGIIALEKLKEQHFDLIVTDTDMPRMNGLIFLQNVRRMKDYGSTTVLVLCDNLSAEEEAEYREEGATAFFGSAGFSREQFLSLLKSLMEEKND